MTKTTQRLHARHDKTFGEVFDTRSFNAHANGALPPRSHATIVASFVHSSAVTTC